MSGIIAQNVGRHAGLIKAPSGGGAWTLIQTLTSDGSDASLSFTSGIDSTYDEYVFLFNNIHPETGGYFLFNGSTDGGSNYDVTTTSTYFVAGHREDDSSTYFQYDGGNDVAQGTDILLSYYLDTANDASMSGYLHLYEPSSTTFVKNFMFCGNTMRGASSAQSNNTFVGGYLNSTSAVDAIQFKMASDEIQGGSISMYGIG